MTGRSAALALALIAALAACSDTGVPQVDRARDAIARDTGIGRGLAPVGRAADRAARRAAAAGKSGDAGEMARAVGGGTVEVLCAGVAGRGEAGREIAGAAREAASSVPGGAAAIDAAGRVAAGVPRPPSPC